MKIVEISTEFIKLGQLLKLADLVGQGSEAKISIAEGFVLVNDEVCLLRGKKIYHDDVVQLKGEEKVKVLSTFKG